jgi:hypothetical protein
MAVDVNSGADVGMVVVVVCSVVVVVARVVVVVVITQPLTVPAILNTTVNANKIFPESIHHHLDSIPFFWDICIAHYSYKNGTMFKSFKNVEHAPGNKKI